MPLPYPSLSYVPTTVDLFFRMTESLLCVRPLWVYATDRSKAVGLVLVLLCVALWFHVEMLSLALLFVLMFYNPFSIEFIVFVFYIPVSIVITSTGEEKTPVHVLLVHLFVYFTHVDFWPFFSSSLCLRLAAACDCGTS